VSIVYLLFNLLLNNYFCGRWEERINKKEQSEEETHTRNPHRWPPLSCFKWFFWKYYIK